MNPLLIYMTKAAFYLAAFSLVYRLLLSRDTHYGRNRVFIMLSLVSALILPFITIKTSEPVNFPIFGKTLREVLIMPSGSGSYAGSHSLDFNRIVLIIYLAGLMIAGIKLLVDLSEIVAIIYRNKSDRNRIILYDGLNTSAFSAFGHIFISSRLSSEEFGEIMKHEQKHLENHHFIDIIIIEIIKAFQWFNPFIYILNRSLREVHEYQADEECLKKGIPVISYQQLLMNQVFATRLFKVSNSFSNPTLVKKRMIMMTKKRSGMLANLKLLMVLPAVGIVMIAFSSCKEKSDTSGGKSPGVTASQPVPIDETAKVVKGEPAPADEMVPPPPPPPPPSQAAGSDAPFVKVDVMPEFPGGDKGLIQFIAENTIYPEKAKKNGIQGKVIVRFAVETNGKIDKISILKGVDPELDAEALRVVSKLPAFEKPGLVNNKAVPVWYMIPINFALR